MKKFINLSLMFGLLAVCCTFTACSSDDDGGGGGTTVNGMRLMSITESKGSTTYTYSYEYNSKGQIVQEIETSSYNGSTYTTNYVYEDDKITKGDRVYILSNGRIVSSYNKGSTSNLIEYKYDNDGQLVSAGSDQFTWSNGNVEKISYSGGGANIYSYSDYSSSALPYASFVGGDWILAAQGYFGKQNSKLPSKITSGSGNVTTCDYTVEQGVVTKLIIQSGSSTYVYTFNWEKI